MKEEVCRTSPRAGPYGRPSTPAMRKRSALPLTTHSSRQIHLLHLLQAPPKPLVCTTSVRAIIQQHYGSLGTKLVAGVELVYTELCGQDVLTVFFFFLDLFGLTKKWACMNQSELNCSVLPEAHFSLGWQISDQSNTGEI